MERIASYRSAITTTLHDRITGFADLIKVYRATPEGERRYSPAEVVSTEVVPVIGEPDPKKICTSHIERQNLTMRMQIRRFTRRIHSTIRVTHAMEAGISDHVWDLAELVA
jgi:hypothetical protein